jgi:hypothetical protein
VDNLAFSFEQLKSAAMNKKAQEMSESFEKEDGVKSGIDAFVRNLPVEDMVCDVSLFLPDAHGPQPKTLFACRWCAECKMKMSLEVDAIVHSKASGRSDHIRTKCVRASADKRRRLLSAAHPWQKRGAKKLGLSGGDPPEDTRIDAASHLPPPPPPHPLS